MEAEPMDLINPNPVLHERKLKTKVIDELSITLIGYGIIEYDCLENPVNPHYHDQNSQIVERRM